MFPLILRKAVNGSLRAFSPSKTKYDSADFPGFEFMASDNHTLESYRVELYNPANENEVYETISVNVSRR